MLDEQRTATTPQRVADEGDVASKTNGFRPINNAASKPAGEHRLQNQNAVESWRMSVGSAGADIPMDGRTGGLPDRTWGTTPLWTAFQRLGDSGWALDMCQWHMGRP